MENERSSALTPAIFISVILWLSNDYFTFKGGRESSNCFLLIFHGNFFNDMS